MEIQQGHHTIQPGLSESSGDPPVAALDKIFLSLSSVCLGYILLCWSLLSSAFSVPVLNCMSVQDICAPTLGRIIIPCLVDPRFYLGQALVNKI